VGQIEKTMLKGKSAFIHFVSFSPRLNSLPKNFSERIEESAVAKATLNLGTLFGRLKPPAPSDGRIIELLSKQ